MQDAAQKNKELEKPNDIKNTDSKQTAIQNEMQKSLNSLQSKDNKSASKSQKSASDQMKDLAQNLKQQMDDAQQEQKQRTKIN